MSEELNQGETKKGKLVAIPDETITAMKNMRYGGKSVKDVADFFHVSTGTVSKYCPPIEKEEPSGNKTSPKTAAEIDQKSREGVLEAHGTEIVETAKKLDAENTQAGKLVQKYLIMLQNKGIDIDLSRTNPVDFMKIVKASFGDEVNMNARTIVDQWSENQLAEKLNTTGKTTGNAGGNSISFSDVKEIILMQLLMKSVAGDNGGNQGNTIAEMKAENEKLRQESRIENDKLRQEMRDIMLEKRFNNIDQERETVIQQLSDLQAQVALVKINASSSDPTVRADALSHLETLATDIDRARGIFSKLGLGGGSGAVTGDGTVDRLLKIGENISRGLTQIRPKEPSPQTQQAPAEQMKPMQPDEYANFLLSMRSRTQEQEQWLLNYQAYLENEQKKLKPVVVAQHVQPASQPAQSALEQAEHIHAQLLQKPAWTNEEATWMNHYEKQRTQMLAQQAATAGEQAPVQQAAPSQEFQPPAEQPTEVQPEEQPGETAVPEEEQPGEKQPEVEIGTIEKIRAADEQRMKALDGLV